MNRQDMDIAGLEDDPDFWNMDVDDKGDERPVRDLTKSKGLSRFLSRMLVLIHCDQARRMSWHNPACHLRKTDPTSCTVWIVLSRSYPTGTLSAIFDRCPASAHLFSRCNHPCKDKTKCRHLW